MIEQELQIPPGEKLSYQEAWRNYRRRRNLFGAIPLTYVPGVAVTGVPLSRVFQTEVPVFVIATLWLLAFAVFAGYLQLWKCPRCRKAFFLKWWCRDPFAEECVHCGLPKWAGDPSRHT